MIVVSTSSIIADCVWPAAIADDSPTGPRARTAKAAALKANFLEGFMVFLQGVDSDGSLLIEICDEDSVGGAGQAI
ncbi:hypothetical protein TM233_39700 [Bradyrhizobium sp. TM233]|nr:hypothetical protein TM233_39700 [Bradyrhizobium sp. TM233]